jgi:colanic acid biosynthesis glycosyl transferase WcaI
MAYIFLNRFFHPDHSATSQMLSDLAFALAEQGRPIRIITSRQRYDAPESRLPARETIAGVDVHRVWTSRFGRMNLVGRAIDYLTFYLSAAWTLWRLARRGDVVIVKTDPPMLSVVAAPITRLRGAKVVNWLQDVFPEVALALGLGTGRLSRPLFAAMRWLRNRSLRHAAANVVLGSRMAEKIGALGLDRQRIQIIPNWSDGQLVQPLDHASNLLRQAWGLEGKFVVGYSGNLGRAHEFATLLDAIAQVEAEASSPNATTAPAIVWLFVGGGALFETFKAEVTRRALQSVRFQPYQPRERLGESLSAIDVHLVSLKPGLEGLIVPSKFYGIAAAGRPNIFIGDADGEIARANARIGCGVTVSEGNSAGLAKIVRELAHDASRCRQMGQAARQAFNQEFDKPIAVQRWLTLLDQCGAAGGHKNKT